MLFEKWNILVWMAILFKDQGFEHVLDKYLLDTYFLNIATPAKDSHS